jgi:hypothetical protein
VLAPAEHSRQHTRTPKLHVGVEPVLLLVLVLLVLVHVFKIQAVKLLALVGQVPLVLHRRVCVCGRRLVGRLLLARRLLRRVCHAAADGGGVVRAGVAVAAASVANWVWQRQ